LKEERSFYGQKLYTDKTLKVFVPVHISVYKAWGKLMLHTLGTAFLRKWYWIASAKKVSSVEGYGIYLVE